VSPLTLESFDYWADSRNRQAAVALLLWLGKAIPTVEAWDNGTGYVPGTQRAIDVDQLEYNSGAWSGGERRTVAVALSLLGHRPVDLADVFGGLGGGHLRAAVQAIVYAAGWRVDDGPLVFAR
jgi:hypothetical protein